MTMANKVTPPKSGNQPGISSTTKVYGADRLRRVRLKDTKQTTVIRESEFDPAKHERLDT